MKNFNPITILRNGLFLFLAGYGMISAIPAVAQQKVKLISSDYVEGGRKNNRRYTKATGHVHLIQGTTEIFCDSAFLYKRENSLEAFGRIKIIDLRDSVTITSDKLTYIGDTRYAQLREHVIYKDDSVTLYTDHLDYNVDNRSAYYFDGGKILKADNELTSVTGFYDTQGKIQTFHKKVVLTNPDNTLKTDTLIYNMITGKAITYGPTTVIGSDGKTAYSDKGMEYLMNTKQTTLEAGTVRTESYVLKGSHLFYDQLHGINHARGNVYMFSKDDDVVITGDFADNDQEKGMTKIYGNPVMKKLFENDTLYLAADTLISLESKSTRDKRMLAYHHVRFFRTDLQGIADSMSYVISDSILFLYHDPVIWNEGNQVTADSINIIFRNNQIDRMNLRDNSFIILTDTIHDYNQLKGKNMTGYFTHNDITRLDVDGNSECLFHALDDKDNSLTGINRVVCSDMTIRFLNNHADNMTFYTNPNASFIPPQELKKEDQQLSGFKWRGDDRPTLQVVLEPYVAKPDSTLIQKPEEALKK